MKTLQTICLSALALLSPLSAKTEKLDLPGARAEVYKKASGDDLYLYIFDPEGHDAAKQKLPAIVFFFGGGWTSGTPTQFEQHARYLAKRGMVAESKGMLAMLAKPHLSAAVDVPSLVRDHLHLYHLFGDPASKLPFAAPLKTMTAPESAAPGSAVAVAAETNMTGAGKATVRLERPRAALLGSKKAAASDADSVRANHRAANDVLVVEVVVDVLDGKFQAVVPVPADLAPGDYLLSVYVAGSADQFAARPLKIAAGAAESR